MPFTLTMPKLSPTMEEGTIAKWHKKVGDFIEAGDVLLEVSTDKATVEYNALDSGWLRQIVVAEGKEAVVNQPIAIFTEEKEESIEGYKPEGVAAKEETPVKPQEVKPQAQKISEEKVSRQPSFVPEAPLQVPTPLRTSGERIKASPLAKKLAKEKNVDLSSLQGTGPGGRIMKRDLDKAPSQKTYFGYREEPTIAAGTYEEESLTPMRKVISQRLQEAKSFIPHFYVSVKINAQPIVDLREQLKHVGTKITYNDMVVKACAMALRHHPVVNSGFNSATNSLIRFKTIDISVAVSIQGGLITPIVRHADFKSLGEISDEIKGLVARAKEGKLESHEYKGGSFTVSNLGMYGVSEFAAIINPPQAAILAVSGVLEVPVVRKGHIVPGLEMTVTLSADHRVIDGVAAAEFLKTLQKYLENPAILFI